jgi:cold shock CspA family protein
VKSKESFNKKAKEQKRFKDRQNKKQKMEERKANKKKGGSLEEMMAYLDENGNLSDTPPDPRNKKVFKQEDIPVGVPAQEPAEEVFRNGTVSFYNKSKGFGFISDAMSSERIFFHVRDIGEPLEESDKVWFQVERSPRGLNAVRITRTDPSTTTK